MGYEAAVAALFLYRRGMTHMNGLVTCQSFVQGRIVIIGPCHSSQTAANEVVQTSKPRQHRDIVRHGVTNYRNGPQRRQTVAPGTATDQFNTPGHE